MLGHTYTEDETLFWSHKRGVVNAHVSKTDPGWIHYSGEFVIGYAKREVFEAEFQPIYLKQKETPPVVDKKFTRAWINLDQLPGGMMVSSQVGEFGPVPASTSCWITTSEQEAERMRHDGPVLEIFTKPKE